MRARTQAAFRSPIVHVAAPLTPVLLSLCLSHSLSFSVYSTLLLISSLFYAGRTGFMTACYLMYAGLQPDAQSALHFFAVQRTRNAKGVTIPSQIRYTHYYDRVLKVGTHIGEARRCRGNRRVDKRREEKRRMRANLGGDAQNEQ